MKLPKMPIERYAALAALLRTRRDQLQADVRELDAAIEAIERLQRRRLRRTDTGGNMLALLLRQLGDQARAAHSDAESETKG